MKKLLLTAFLSCLSFTIFAQGIEFFEGTWEEAKAEAKKTNKHIFMDAYTTWCGPCKMLKKKVFPNEEVGKVFNESYINVAFDMEKGEGIELAKRFEVKAYPTLLFFSPEGELVHVAVGASQAPEFAQLGKDALDPTKQLVSLKNKAAENGASKEDIFNYVRATYSAYQADKVFLKKWLESLSDEDFEMKDVSETVVLAAYLSDLNSPVLAYLPKVKTEKDVVDGAYSRMAGNTLSPLMRAEEIDQKQWDETIATVKEKLPSELTEKVITQFSVSYAFKTKDYDKASMNIDKLIALSSEDSPKRLSSILNSYAWTYYKQNVEAKYMKKALTWITRSVQLDANYANVDTQAHIYLALEKYEKAKEAAEKSIALGNENGQDTSSTEKLLEKINAAMN